MYKNNVVWTRFPDQRGPVFVAGWGKHSDSRCTTNEFGPSPNVKCKFPFTFKLFTFSGCSKLASPSTYEEFCSKLQVGRKQNNLTYYTRFEP